MEKFPICLPLTLSPHTLFCQCISRKAFLRTSLHKRFELLQILKALATGCDVVLAFDRSEMNPEITFAKSAMLNEMKPLFGQKKTNNNNNRN